MSQPHSLPDHKDAASHGEVSKTSLCDVKPIPDGDSLEKQSVAEGAARPLAQKLRSRHMQMIAIGLFVGSGSALHVGGPLSLVLGFSLIGFMILCTMQALGELAVLYPINGAFYLYTARFLDRSWAFAMGWEYALGWLTVLPFELIALSITIEYWRDDIHVSIWVAVFLVMLFVVQFFGVRGYGEVEFVLSMVKVCACIGFIIFGIIVNVGGVPTDDRGYIGFRYWKDPGVTNNGFKGFCSIFVTAAFAFGGTELVGLAAAEATNPAKSLPKATRQVVFRIAAFYILNLFILGLILPSNNPQLMGASGANTKASPFVLAIKEAGVKVLPSIFNAVITISVLSVANSCTFGSSRTMQALAANGMGPKFLAYVDNKGRPLWCLVVQLLFGFIAFLGESGKSGVIFTWLLALSALCFNFVWMSICVTHISKLIPCLTLNGVGLTFAGFRAGWKHRGYTLEQLPYRAGMGVYGSWIGAILNLLAIVATFYVSLFPVGSPPSAKGFFATFLAAPIVILLYLFWKIYTRDWRLFIHVEDMDIDSGIRQDVVEASKNDQTKEEKSNQNVARRCISRIYRFLF